MKDGCSPAEFCEFIFAQLPGPYYWDTDEYWDSFPGWEGTGTGIVELATELFERPSLFADSYSSIQIANGLSYLNSATGEGLMWRLMGPVDDDDVSWEKQRRCLRAIPILFEKFFTPRMQHALDDGGADYQLDTMCFMWWDASDCYAGQAERPDFDEEALQVMEKILALDSYVCQESALHGLGQWQREYPDRVAAVIDAYLKRNPDLPEKVREYAEDAAKGEVI